MSTVQSEGCASHVYGLGKQGHRGAKLEPEGDGPLSQKFILLEPAAVSGVPTVCSCLLSVASTRAAGVLPAQPDQGRRGRHCGDPRVRSPSVGWDSVLC